MGKRGSIKRLSSISQSASNSIDIKARKRIEELYELTDEIINAYNEINEKYVNRIYRKYQRLQEINKNLKKKLDHHHCTGCKCTNKSNEDNEEEEEESENSEEEEKEDDDEQTKTSALPSSTTNSVTTRNKKNNPFIISDIEETQNFDADDSRFNNNPSDNEEDKTSMETNEKATNNNNNNESDDEEGKAWKLKDENRISFLVKQINNNLILVDEDNGMARLPLALQAVIRNKAKKNKNAKAYLLKIPRYPAICEFLRDKSRTSFDHRPSENQVRPLIANHISKYLANDKKVRMRLRDELREIHRSFMRTFMTDPHSTGLKSSIQKNKLPVKKSPM